MQIVHKRERVRGVKERERELRYQAHWLVHFPKEDTKANTVGRRELVARSYARMYECALFFVFFVVEKTTFKMVKCVFVRVVVSACRSANMCGA
jgi:hypothetical protein